MNSNATPYDEYEDYEENDQYRNGLDAQARLA
jgi:hypothetical protein